MEGKGSTKTLESAVGEFILDRQIGGCTKATIESYNWQLQPLLQWTKTNDVALRSMTAEHLRDFLVFRSAVGKQTLYHATVRLKTFFRWCAEHQVSAEPREQTSETTSVEAGHQRAEYRGTSNDAVAMPRERLRQPQR